MALADHADAKSLELALAVDFAFSSGNLRLWSGPGTRTFEQNDYTGVGELIKIGQLIETEDIRSVGMTVSLAGVQTSLLSLALGGQYQNAPVTIWMWVITGAGIDGEVIFRGFVDTINFEDGKKENVMTATIESQLARLERPAVDLYSQSDLDRRHPGDKGLEFIEHLVDKNIVWGVRGQATVRPS